MSGDLDPGTNMEKLWPREVREIINRIFDPNIMEMLVSERINILAEIECKFITAWP